MNATVVCTLVLGSIIAAPARLPVDREYDIVQIWLEDLERDGRVNIEFAGGQRVEIRGKQVRGRKLINPTVRFFDRERLTSICSSKEAELRVVGRLLKITFWDGTDYLPGEFVVQFEAYQHDFDLVE